MVSTPDRSGRELPLALDRSAAVPLGSQLQNALRDAIRSGQLRSGERLPSTRTLALQLGVSRGLVVSTFDQLVAEGYLVAGVGSGTRVVDGLFPPPSARSSHQVETDPTPSAIDFGYGVPDLRAFPTRDWLWATSEAIRTTPSAGLGDGPVEGDPHLCTVLADYHRRTRGGCAHADDAIVVGGFRHGLGLVLRALRDHGIEHLALEDPGPREHDTIAMRAGLRVSAVPVDDDGLDVAALRAGDARAVLVTPAHQCPTGAVLSPARRHQLVQWAREVDGVIVEDDYDAEFRYDRSPVGSLQGLAPDRVIALGSVSKTLAPALRLGWVFARPPWRAAIAEEKYLSCRDVPRLEQVALARLIESGRFDRHLRRVRDSYRQRRDAVVSGVRDHLAGARVIGLDAGHHVVVRLPPDVSERRLVVRARAAGIAVRGVGEYRSGADPVSPLSRPAPGLVIGFGNVSVARIEEGLRLLGDLAKESDGHPME